MPLIPIQPFFAIVHTLLAAISLGVLAAGAPRMLPASSPQSAEERQAAAIQSRLFSG